MFLKIYLHSDVPAIWTLSIKLDQYTKTTRPLKEDIINRLRHKMYRDNVKDGEKSATKNRVGRKKIIVIS